MSDRSTLAAGQVEDDPDLAMGILFAPDWCVRCRRRIERGPVTERPQAGVARLEGGALITARCVGYCRRCAEGLRICRTCGCTDEAGCEEGCWWVSADLCSSCAGKGAAHAS